jgi:carboxylate-amine ligase
MPETGTDAASQSLDRERTRAAFEESTDFTVGLEEEFALLDPQTLELVHRYEDLKAACDEDDRLAVAAAGELIDTEIEIRSGRGESFSHAVEMQQDHRSRLFRVAEDNGIALAAMGTHPWANYLDQRIIDTEHYNRLRDELRWVAQRNNTWSLHVHVGVRGADRAIAVCDHLRGALPALLAASANSPFLDGQDTGLASVRTEIFTRTFPRCGVHEPFGGYEAYADFVDALVRTSSIVESTQLWWSVRPHHGFGTVEFRICDAQTRGDESFALAGLIAACISQAAMDHSEGALPEPLGGREIEENLWRALRWGMDGKLIDWDAVEEIPAETAVERLMEWTGPARAELGIDVELPPRNGTQRARDAAEAGASIEQVYRDAVAETRRTYAPA